MTSNGKPTEPQYEKVPIEEKNEEKEKEEIAAYGCGVRHVQSLLIFMCLGVSFIARAHLGVTIVAMVDEPKSNNSIHENGTVTIEDNFNKTIDAGDSYSIVLYDNVTNNDDFQLNNYTDQLVHESYENPHRSNSNFSIGTETEMENDTTNTWSIYRTYNWPKSTQEMVLGSFFWGYFVMMLPIGVVCQRWGGKLPLQFSLFINGVVSALTPWFVAWGGWKAVCACRALQGLAQAGTYPGALCLLAAWVPARERGSLTTYVLSGTILGTIVAFQVGGLLAASPWGWPATFWFTGLMCLAAFTLVTIFGSATPHGHAFITDAEKQYILGTRDITGEKKNHRTPWRALMTSKRVWAVFIAHVGSGTTFVFFFSQVASYLHYILGVNVKKSGIFSSLPYMANFLASFLMGYLSDYCTNRNILSIKTSRILFNSIAAVGVAVCLVAVSFTKSTVLAVMFFVVALAAHAGVHTGWMLNYIDIAPRYTGALMAVGNTLMNVMVLALPALVANIVTDVTNPYQWRIVLFLMAGLSSLCHIIFVTFMTSDLQPWNDSLEDLHTGRDAEEMDDKETKDLQVNEIVNGK